MLSLHQVLLEESLFKKINEYALMSYVKKKQFEGANIECSKCIFNISKDKIFFKDEYSEIEFLDN